MPPTNKRPAWQDCRMELAANKRQKICIDSYSAKISSKLTENYGCLMDSDDHKDFVLKCAEEEIRVHKCILAARSPVFAAMFRSDMNEAQGNSVVIVDVEPGILRKVLKFIYSGQIDNFTNAEAGDILYAANKYQLDILKEVCVESLKSNLSADNVFEAIRIGHLFDQSLKDKAVDLVCKHDSFSEIKETDGWKSLQTTNPTLAMEVVISVVEYLQKRRHYSHYHAVLRIAELKELPDAKRERLLNMIHEFLKK